MCKGTKDKREYALILLFLYKKRDCYLCKWFSVRLSNSSFH